jgi:16S rRNA G1207 methylase RsmC
MPVNPKILDMVCGSGVLTIVGDMHQPVNLGTVLFSMNCPRYSPYTEN